MLPYCPNGPIWVPDGYVLDGLNLVKIDKDKNTKYILRFDGACRGNPSDELGLGCILYENGTKIDERSQKINVKSGTNNQAEYLAMLSGLKMCLNNNIKNVLVQGDSELIIKQINGLYKVNNEKLLTYYNIALSLKLQFENITFQHIKREQNKEADQLANKALDDKDTQEWVWPDGCIS